MNFGILVLVLALVLFGVLAFLQLSALILAPLVSIFVIICSKFPVELLPEGVEKMTILTGLKQLFMPAASAYVTSYFLVFFVGALFGAVYQFTGAAESISKWIAGFSKGKYAAPIIFVITMILTYGGVSGFVVFFVIYPIALNLFKESNLTRRLIPAAISAGCWTVSMVAVIVEFILIFVWLEWRARSFTAKGYYFDDPRLKFQLDPEELGQGGREDLPHWGIALTPIIIILVLFNGFKVPVEASVFAGVASATILMWKKVPGGIREWLKVFNKGAADSGVSILNTAIVVGFGGIVQKTQGFQDLVAALKTWNISPLVFVMLTVAICAGACGSASGGMGVAFNALTDTYIELGANLEQVHRIAAIAAGTLDTLPHQGAQITLLGICKMTHKEAYFDIFVTQIAIPFIACFVFIACCGFM